jgi:hypothetical protein
MHYCLAVFQSSWADAASTIMIFTFGCYLIMRCWGCCYACNIYEKPTGMLEDAGYSDKDDHSHVRIIHFRKRFQRMYFCPDSNARNAILRN